jgi:hypothetical protein
MVTSYGAGIHIKTKALSCASSSPHSEVFCGLTTVQYDCVSSLGLPKCQNESHHQVWVPMVPGALPSSPLCPTGMVRLCC